MALKHQSHSSADWLAEPVQMKELGSQDGIKVSGWVNTQTEVNGDFRDIYHDKGNDDTFDEDTMLKLKDTKLNTHRTDIDTNPISALHLKPRYNPRAIKTSFRNSLAALDDPPIEYYESLLYQSTSIYTITLNCFPLSFFSIDNIHHICQLKKEEEELSKEVVHGVNENLEEVVNGNSYAFEEYKLMCKLIHLANALLVKWRVVNYEEYSYKISGRAMNVRLLDLEKLNSALMTPESFWFSCRVFEKPLRSKVDESVRQYSLVFQQEAIRVFNYMLTMNDIDFHQHPSIDGYLAVIEPTLHTKFHFVQDYVNKPPEYQQLRQPEGVIAKCMKSTGQARAMKLKKLLKNLEMAHRSFEKSLVGAFLI